MKEKYIHTIDVLLESLRSHMNLLIGELKEHQDEYAAEQLTRIERDVKVIRNTFDEGLREKNEEEKEEKEQ